MKQKKMHQIIVGVVIMVSIILLAGRHHAYATGTTANTPVSSIATINYDVGGLGQPSVPSTGGSFLVDRRILLTVAEVGTSYTSVTPSATLQALKFTVTNNTNDVVDFRLVYVQDTTSTPDPFGGTDDFDTTAVLFYQDANANGNFDGTTTDTLITFVDEVAADTFKTIFVVSNIPVGRLDAETSFGTLTAIAAVGGTGGSQGADHVQIGGAESPSVVETVFGDAAGDTDAVRDGKHSDDDGYKVVSATITVTKTITVKSDPFNGTTTPRAIPGATVEYCIQVSNTGSAAAANVVIADPIPVNSTYATSTLVAGGTVTAGACNADGTPEDDDSIGADETDPNGGNFNAGTNKITAIIPNLPLGTTTTARFQVTVN